MTGYVAEAAGEGPADFCWTGRDALSRRAVPSAFSKMMDAARSALAEEEA